MNRAISTYLFVMTILFAHFSAAFAQSGFYIPDSGSLAFHNDTFTIFSNVINRGNIRIGQDGRINFTGVLWQNGSNANITNCIPSRPAGIVQFSSISIPGRQQLDGGYNDSLHTGPSFPNLLLQNANGLELVHTHARIKNELRLEYGSFTLNDHKLIIGNNDAGIISGYDSTKFIITNDLAHGGELIREKISSTDGMVVFPVGSAEEQYTPLAVKRLSGSAGYSAGVMDSVFRGSVTGPEVNSTGVSKAWYVRSTDTKTGDGTKTGITVQHHVSDEGLFFRANRKNSYISRFAASKGWDIGYPQYYPIDGDLEQTSNDPSTGINGREFRGLGSGSYFTLLTGEGEIYKNKVLLSGDRVNENQVELFWKTGQEIFNSYFIVQRRLFNETDFSNVDSVSSQVIAQYNFTDMHYTDMDNNSYSGTSIYRLAMIGAHGELAYSNTISIDGSKNQEDIVLWPNPAHGHFYIGITEGVVVTKVLIYESDGQLVHDIPVNDQGIIHVEGMKAGIYIVKFIAPGNKAVENKRMVIY